MLSVIMAKVGNIQEQVENIREIKRKNQKEMLKAKSTKRNKECFQLVYQ